jgi:hypothetical protein
MGTKKIEEKKSKSEKKYKYRGDGTGFNVNKMVPDAAPGEYIASIKRIEMRADKKGYPRMDISLQIIEAVTDTDEAKKSEKAMVFDRIGFLPMSEGKRSNFQKQQLRKLCSHLDVDLSLAPSYTGGANDEDFEELMDAIKEAGQEFTIWIAHRTTEDDSGEKTTWTDVKYVAPRSDAASTKKAKDEDEDEAEEEEEEEENDDEEEERPRKKKAVAKDEDPDDDDDDDDDEDDLDEEDDEDEEEEEEKPKARKKSRR